LIALKRLRVRLDEMTDHTYALLRGALLLSSTMAVCALALLLFSGGLTIAGFEAYKAAQELIALGAFVLFLAVLASGIVEEISMGR